MKAVVRVCDEEEAEACVWSHHKAGMKRYDSYTLTQIDHHAYIPTDPRTHEETSLLYEGPYLKGDEMAFQPDKTLYEKRVA